MLKFLVPPFIKNIDKTLVLNYPFWYIVKMHYLVYFTAIMWAISFLVGCLLPIDITEYNPMNVTGIWIFVFSVVGVILFCVWMYYLTIYNSEDHFGKFSIWDDTKLLLILLLGINMLISFSYPMQLRVKARIANMFTDTELAEQYNKLNLANKYMTSSLDDFQYCGYNIHDTVDVQLLSLDTTENGDQRFNYDLSKYKNFRAFSPENDDHFDYRMFLFPVASRVISTEFKHSLLNESQIEYQYTLHKSDADKLKALTAFSEVVNVYENRYSNYHRYTPQDYLDNYNHLEKKCTTYFPSAYNAKPEDRSSDGAYFLPVDNVTPYMRNIYEAKFELPFIASIAYLMFAFYFSFFTALLVILFRNNKWQHYLVSAVSVILLGIIIGIISLAIGYSSESCFPTLCILTWIAAGAISLQYYFRADRYRIVGAVATNLFYLAFPLMPFFLCLYAHEVFGWLKCYNSYSNDAWEMAQCEIMNSTFQDALLYAQIIGILAFVIGVMPFYKSFFATQKALPRDK
jgi:hypothetical protein